MTTKPTTTKNDVIVTVFCAGGDWFGAVWIDGEYDCQLDLDAASLEEAIEEARGHYPCGTVIFDD